MDVLLCNEPGLGWIDMLKHKMSEYTWVKLVFGLWMMSLTWS